MPLSDLGWDAAFQQSFDELRLSDVSPSRVVRHDRTGYLVVHDHGECFARLAGRLREEAPAVGDWVALDLSDPPTIRAILPRRTAFIRQAAGRETRAQVVAANVDVLYVVAGLDDDLNLRRLERYQAIGASSGARIVIVLNKADLASPDDPRIAQVRAAAREVALVSASTGEGVEALRPRPGETAAFVGSSGVGKSSLINRLMGEELLTTQGLRAKDGRGRHTTTARHLLQLPGGGMVLDTPGMREVALWDAEEGVAQVFADIEALAARCKFRDCAHDTEPGCAVRAGVAPERLLAWRKLQREVASAARRADVAAERKQSRAWAKVAKRTLEGKRARLRE